MDIAHVVDLDEDRTAFLMNMIVKIVSCIVAPEHTARVHMQARIRASYTDQGSYTDRTSYMTRLRGSYVVQCSGCLVLSPLLTPHCSTIEPIEMCLGLLR